MGWLVKVEWMGEWTGRGRGMVGGTDVWIDAWLHCTDSQEFGWMGWKDEQVDGWWMGGCSILIHLKIKTSEILERPSLESNCRTTDKHTFFYFKFTVQIWLWHLKQDFWLGLPVLVGGNETAQIHETPSSLRWLLHCISEVVLRNASSRSGGWMDCGRMDGWKEKRIDEPGAYGWGRRVPWPLRLLGSIAFQAISVWKCEKWVENLV